jgi:hypothetical protein
MTKNSDVIAVVTREVTRGDSWAMLDEKTRRYLDISAKEFAERYKEGTYDGTSDAIVMRLSAHLGFLQHETADAHATGDGGESDADCSDLDEDDEFDYHEITREEAWAMLDDDTRRYLGVGAAEFARRYNANEYGDPDDDPKLMRLAMELESLQRNEAVTP